jgi:succinyl-CoA synthetase alpha subunit
MAILVNQDTRCVIQGATGQGGKRFIQRMIDFGSPPVAGVTPGKGGEEVAGVPVFDTVKEAVEKTGCDFSSINVPPALVKDAAFEAFDAGIRKIFMYAERVPLHDAMQIMAYGDEIGATMVGPNSPGIVSPGKYRLGGLGGDKEYVAEIFKEGEVGLCSRSGGMTSTLGYTISQGGLGLTTAVGLGGDAIIGSPFTKVLPLFEADPETKAICMFCEIGGSMEEEAAELIKSGAITKPIVAFIAGREARAGFRFGHAGALVERGRGTYESKVQALSSAKVAIAKNLRDIPVLLREALGKPAGREMS